MLPSFWICCICERMSSRVNWFFTSRWAMPSASFSSILSLACSMRVSTSPMPRMRWAMRSGWKRSKSSSFSPLPTNFMGVPVMWRMLKAAPPRVSPSALVRTTPVMASFSWKAPAERTASWPVMASATNRISTGAQAALMRASSSIRVSSRCRRPAVSRITTSQPFRTASCTAAAADGHRIPAVGAETGHAGVPGHHVQLLDGRRAVDVGGHQQRANGRSS